MWIPCIPVTSTTTVLHRMTDEAGPMVYWYADEQWIDFWWGESWTGL